jgi:hypothetical protein
LAVHRHDGPLRQADRGRHRRAGVLGHLDRLGQDAISNDKVTGQQDRNS